VRRIVDFEQPQVLEPATDPWKVAELAIFQDLGIARRERRAAGEDRVDRAGFLVEQRDEKRVGAIAIGQLLKAGLQALLGIGQGDRLKVDGDFGADQIEPVPARQLCRPADKAGCRGRFLELILFNDANAPMASSVTTALGTSPLALAHPECAHILTVIVKITSS